MKKLVRIFELIGFALWTGIFLVLGFIIGSKYTKPEFKTEVKVKKIKAKKDSSVEISQETEQKSEEKREKKRKIFNKR